MNVVRTFDIRITVAVEMTEQEYGQCVNIKSWENDIKDVIESELFHSLEGQAVTKLDIKSKEEVFKAQQIITTRITRKYPTTKLKAEITSEP